MNRLFLKQKNRGYIQKRPTIYRFQKRKRVYKMRGESRTFHPCFGEGLSYNIQSAEDGLVQVSIHKFQVIFACAESSRSSQTEWAVLWLSSFSIFPTRLHELQLLMRRLQQQFLRSQHDRWSRISLWETNWPPTESITMNKSFFPPSNSVQCLISRLLPSWDLFLHKSKPWSDMKTNIEKRKLNPEMKKLEVSNTPQSISPSLQQHSPVCCVLLQSVDKYWQL